MKCGAVITRRLFTPPSPSVVVRLTNPARNDDSSICLLDRWYWPDLVIDIVAMCGQEGGHITPSTVMNGCLGNYRMQKGTEGGHRHIDTRFTQEPYLSPSSSSSVESMEWSENAPIDILLPGGHDNKSVKQKV